MESGFSEVPPGSRAWGWVRVAVLGPLGFSVIGWASSSLLACLQDALAGAAGKAWGSVVGPILPNLLVPVRSRDPLVGTLVSSPDFAFPATGDAHTLGVRLEADAKEEDFFMRQLGGFNRVFLGPNLLGTGRDRLPWPGWLPLAGRPAASTAVLGLSRSATLWDSFSFRNFIL